GSDAVGMRSKAGRVDGGFIINENKMLCTNGSIADTLRLRSGGESGLGGIGNRGKLIGLMAVVEEL
ncbi:isovaleryl-CoA dehydrogenase, mitochondrial-like protein, partial [Tanacetum coccineum]